MCVLALATGSVESVSAQGGEIAAQARLAAAPKEFRGDVRRLPAVPTKKWDQEFSQGEDLNLAKRLRAPERGGPVEQNLALAPMPNPSLTFAGISHDGLCGGAPCGGGWPPDTNGDVGLNYYVQQVNTSVGIFNKSGTLLASFTENALWSGAGTGTPCDANNQGDPITLYDPMTDRWILSDFGFGFSGSTPVAPYYQCIAVSKTGDPVTGGWWLYALRTDDATHPWLNDYPKFGVWPDGVYMSVNGFLGSGSFQGTEAWALNRSDLESGVPVRAFVAYIASVFDPFTMIPSNVRGNTPGGQPPAGTPNYFVSESQTAFAFEVRKFTVASNWSSASLSGATNVAQTSYSVPSGNIIPQPNPGNTLDSLGDRLMQKVQYRRVGANESLWITHTFSVSSGGVTGSQWAQINVTGGTINSTPVQQQKYDPADGLYRWMSSIAADNAGNVALGYSASSSTVNPSLRYTGRLAGDPLNALPQTEAILFSGAGVQSNTCGGAPCHRWGDYSEMTVDPADDCTFWYTNEYYTANGGNWNTRVGNFRFPAGNCTDSPVSQTNHTVVFDGAVGADWKQSAERLGTTGSFDYQVTWDANNLYAGIKGGPENSNYTYVAVVDTDPYAGAANVGASAALACAGGFNSQGKGDFALVRTGQNGSTAGSTSKRVASGGTWASWTPSSNTDARDWGRNMAEFQFAWSDLGLSGVNNTVGLYLYVCNAGALASAWPPENVQAGAASLLIETVFATNDASRTPRTYGVHYNVDTANAVGLVSLLNGYVRLNVTTPGAASCTMSATVSGNNDGTASNLIRRTYLLTPTNCSGLVADMTLKYEDGTTSNNAPSELKAFSESTMQLLRYNGTSWTDVGASSRDTTNNTMTKLGVSQFSPWSFGSATPTAVDLASFRGRYAAPNVRLTWKTATETNLVGFNLWRSRRADGTFNRLNSTLIRAKHPGSGLGDTYRRQDKDLKGAGKYYYKLELIRADGTSVWSDLIPVEVPLVPSTAPDNP
jgi:hypothetical protein